LVFFVIFALIFLFYNYVTGPEGNLGTNYHIRGVLEGKKGIYENVLGNASSGLMSYLFGNHYGLFVFSPLALLSIFGFGLFWSRNKTICLVFILLVGTLVIIHSWGHPGAGGFSLPTRYLVPIIPLLAVPLGFLIEKFLKKPIFLGILIPISIIGMIINIKFSSLISQHGSSQFKSEIASQVYFGLLEFLPHFPHRAGGLYVFEPPHFIFFFFVSGIIVLFVLFVFHPFFKNIKR